MNRYRTIPPIGQEVHNAKNLYFGKVKRYIDARGFGFISCIWPDEKTNQDIFFHIKTIERRWNYSIYDTSNNLEGLYFWFEIKNTPKGIEVSAVFYEAEVINNFHEKLLRMKRNFSKILQDANQPLYNSLKNVIHSIPELEEEVHEYEEKVRIAKEKEEEARRIREEELKRREEEMREIARKREEKARVLEEQRKIEREQKAKEAAIAEAEFQALVREMRPFRFTQSASISNYITRNKIGQKYKNISGLLKMKSGNDDEWLFDGGISPLYYRRLCAALKLDNMHGSAYPIEFTPYANLEEEKENLR